MALPIRDQAKYWGMATADSCGHALVYGQCDHAVSWWAARLPISSIRWPTGWNAWACQRVAATPLISQSCCCLRCCFSWQLSHRCSASLTALINSAPEILKQLQSFLTERFPELTDSTSTIRQTLAQIGEAIGSQGTESWQIRCIGSALTVDQRALCSWSWCRWSRSICCWTGTIWLPASTRFCRVTMRL